jgi:hypothetical protein
LLDCSAILFASSRTVIASGILISLLIGFKFSLSSFLFKFFCSFSLALLTDAKLLSLASISSLKALETVNLVSLFFVPNLSFLPSLSPLSLFVALCSASFLLSKSFVIDGVFSLFKGFNEGPRLNDEAIFDLTPVPEGLKDPAFLLKLFFDFSITTEFFP